MIFDKYLRTYCGGTYYMTHCRQKYRPKTLASLQPVDKLCTYYTSIDSNQGTNLQKGHSSSQNVRNVLPKTLSIWALPFSGWIPAKETGYTNRSQSITLGMGPSAWWRKIPNRDRSTEIPGANGRIRRVDPCGFPRKLRGLGEIHGDFFPFPGPFPMFRVNITNAPVLQPRS